MRKPILYSGLCLALIAIVGGLYAVKSHQTTRTRPPFTPVITPALVTRQDIPLILTALGTVMPNNTVTVHSRVDGELQQLGFTEGQHVKKGQMLAQLDPRPFQVALTQARGQLASDRAQLKNAQIDLARYRTLRAQNSISEQQFATQKALVEQLKGTVLADLGAVQSAQLQLQYSRILAPLSGRVGLKQTDLGNIVHASDSNGIVVITQMQPAMVVFSLPETNLNQLSAALKHQANLAVSLWDRDNRQQLATGQLVAIDNQIDTSTGTVKLKALFANRDESLFPNQFVNVRLQISVQHNAVVIPLAALQRGAPGNYVYLIQADKTVTLRPIKPGPSYNDTLIVEQGLNAGDLVVVDGVDRMREGMKITLLQKAKDKGQNSDKTITR